MTAHDLDIEFAPHLETVDIQPDSWEPVNLNTLPDQPPVQPTLGGIGIVYPGKRHVFSGPQESAKTLAAYAIGLQVVRAPGTLILIDFEMGAWDTRNRLQDLGATEDDLERIHYLEPHEPATTTRIDALLELHADLVIIDAAAGAYDLQGLDDNKRQDVEKLTSLYIKRFWRNNTATIFLDHVVKNTDTRGKYAIGSERKVGGADVHLGFEVITPISRGHTGLYKIITHKDRGGYLKRGTLAELELRSDPETHRIGWELKAVSAPEDGQEWLPTKVMEKVSVALALKDEPISRKQLMDEIGGRHDIARKAIDKLVELGYATETDGARGAKLVENSTLFTLHEWETQPQKRPSPTSSHLVPDEVSSPRPTSSPPYGGRDGVTGNGTTPPSPDFWDTNRDWINELEPEPKEDEPGDLHDPPARNVDDDLPY